MKRVIIAPDSFKGTLSAREVCDTVGEALHSLYEDVSAVKIPVADGGEGTAETLCTALSGKKVFLNVKGPLGNDIQAFYVMLEDKRAVIEMALASGLTVEKKKDALLSSTYGTGQLIKKALDDGARELIIAIGGSATTDGGTGCLAALGAKFSNKEGKELYPCGKSLGEIFRIELSSFDERIKATKITLMCDVKNPLYGEKGAAFVFAPQKGASQKEVMLLDEGLRHYAGICKEALNRDYSFSEGAGAAGGLGFALVAFCGAQAVSGIDLVLDLCDFDARVREAELIITGEGSLDSQSLMGKVPFGVASRCKGKRVVALVGVSQVSEDEIKRAGISQVVETNPEHLPFEEIKHCAKAMLYGAVKKIKL